VRGRNTFVFRRVSDSPARRPDIITDFKIRKDTIDLLRFDIDLRQPRRQRFTEYRGRQPFSGRRGQLRFDAATNALEADTTGDGRANFRVILQGVKRLPARAVKLR
jgi:hypothetical protein